MKYFNYPMSSSLFSSFMWIKFFRRYMYASRTYFYVYYYVGKNGLIRMWLPEKYSETLARSSPCTLQVVASLSIRSFLIIGTTYTGTDLLDCVTRFSYFTCTVTTLLGDLAAAEENHIQALRIRQRYSVTTWHPEVITSLHNLMMVYIADQKISIATDYAYEVFKVCQKIHGMRDARTVEAFRKLTELSKRASQGRGFDFSLAAHEYVERLSCL